MHESYNIRFEVYYNPDFQSSLADKKIGIIVNLESYVVRFMHILEMAFILLLRKK